MATLLRDHPDLRPFILHDVRPTGRTIGVGSYGSIEEVAIPGAVCAVKKIHEFFQDPARMPQEGIEKASREFVRECQLMSTLRHPHIVQFLGVCFLPGSRMPALVMEMLQTSLHEILDPEPPPPTKAFIPVSLKRSILHDVASGLSFLHSHSPPIIHRDLSARNVLLSVGMVAKIADLGVARIVPSLRAATMTKAPGASIYMPPEALEDESRYDATIDIFSMGVLAIFILSQTFPKPLSAAYMDKRGVMVGRTELERRGNYMQQIQTLFREDHPLVQMIQRCLKNRIVERPTICQVLQLLERARAEINDGEYDMSKLALVQALRQREQLLQSKEELIKQQQVQIEKQKQQIKHQQRKIELQGELIIEKDLQSKVKQIEQQQQQQLEKEDKQVKQVKQDKQQQQIKQKQEWLQIQEKTPHLSRNLKVQSLHWPLSLEWRRGKDIPIGIMCGASSVIIDGSVYCGGNESADIVNYDPETGEWSKLTQTLVCGCAMTPLNGQLALVGCAGSRDKITVWDDEHSKWTHPYPPMPTTRGQSAAVGYENYLITACGNQLRDTVQVLDSSSGRWYSGQSVPVGSHCMSSALVGDRWYLSSFGGWKDEKEHIFWAHLPSLISTATSTHSSPVWHELPTPPVERPALLALRGHLLLVGGRGCVQELHRYDPDTEQWRECGKLPLAMLAPCVTVLPSGQLMVAGGKTGDTGTFSQRVWLGNIQS